MTRLTLWGQPCDTKRDLGPVPFSSLGVESTHRPRPGSGEMRALDEHLAALDRRAPRWDVNVPRKY